MSTRTRFEEEAKGNSETAYCKTYDVVNKQADTDSRQLDWKWCSLIYILVALIFYHEAVKLQEIYFTVQFGRVKQTRD